MKKNALYFMTRFALTSIFVCGFIFAPEVVSAQKNLNKEIATYDMIFQALNLKSASGVTVVAENGVTDKGNSSIRGNVSSLKNENQQFRTDLSDSFSAIDQLPCVELPAADLGGKTFKPGVYCMDSANLSGELALDGNNDPNAIFVFRVRGSFNTEKDSTVSLVNNAQAASTFFVADDAANVGKNSTLKGNLFARDSIFIGSGATVEGKTISLKGAVILNGNILGPQQTGFLEICKEIDTAGGAGLENRIFSFKIGALTVEVLPGQCSGPIALEAGPVQLVEQQTGRTLTDGTYGTFTGNFQLTSVKQLNFSGQPNTSVLTSYNLPQFTANVNIVAGTVQEEAVIKFTNRFAITAIVEICKEAIDSGVSGFFNFKIDGLTNGVSTVDPVTGMVTPAPLVQFPVPTGLCTGPIAVVVPTDVASGLPRAGQVTINELPKTGFIFTSATTAPGTAGTPTNRLLGFNTLASGGGNATVTVVAGSDGGITSGSGLPVQTTVFFNNRTAPGQLKICKIAGPGIANSTPFTFEVQGIVPFDAISTDTTVPVNTNTVLTSGLSVTQNPSQGVLNTGALIQGGTVQNRAVTIIASPSSVQGGFCQIVDRTFLVDTAVSIRETGPATVTIVNADQSSTGVTGQARISRINSTTGIISTLTAAQALTPDVGTTYSGNTQPSLIASPISGAGTIQPNTNFFPSGSAITTGVVVPIRRGVTEVEFVNIAFTPVSLKICKIAGAGVTIGTPFTFTVTADTAGGLLAPFSSTVTVMAGPAAVNPGDQDGFCDFATGPFLDSPIAGLGSFNFNTGVTITETASTGFVTSSIISPTSSVIVNLSNRAATISKMINGVNILQVTNTAFTPDETPPVITPTITGTQGNNGFYTSNVTISWNVSDSDSSISSTTGCGSTTISADTAGTTLTCSASSAGGSATKSVTIKRDATAPSLTFSSPNSVPNANGWYNSNVSFPYTASDNLSGVSASTPSGTLIISGEGNSVTRNVTITDNAGNSATFTSPPVKIDKTPPVLLSVSNNTVDLSDNSDPAVSTAAVNYAVSVSDNFDSAPLVNCSPISGSIFQLGSTNVTCNAVDEAGNNATTRVFQVYVLKTVTNVGTNVPVAPAPNLNLNFSNVSTAGTTAVTPLSQSDIEPLPANFSLIGSPILYDVTTTAAFSGDITITFDVPNIASAAACSQLRILHYTNNNWDSSNNIPPVYNAGTRICTVSQIVTSLSPFEVVTTNGTTAATVSIGGRVMTTTGSAITNARLSLTDANGRVRTTTTNKLGYYSFDDVEVGQIYVFEVLAKYYSFQHINRLMRVNGEATDINFIGVNDKKGRKN